MTRAEMMEDIKSGDVVKFYTESDETFEGKVVDFGESAIKIELPESGTTRRIVYGRITEYVVVSTEHKVRSNDQKVVKEDTERYKGIVSNYNKDKGTGTIKNLKGEFIFFYIRQVKDPELQRILVSATNYKRRVTYTQGLNFRGNLAADEIELDEECEGFIASIDIQSKRGKIQSGSILVNFNFEYLADPLLRAEIINKPDSILQTAVRFYSSDYVSKKTNRKSKIAMDIVGTKEYSQQEIDELVEQGFVSREVVDEWLENQKVKNEDVEEGLEDKDSFRTISYEPLVSNARVMPSNSYYANGQGHSAEQQSINRETSEAEKRAVAMVLPPNSDNPFFDMPKDLSGRYYYADAYRYMVGYEGSNGTIIGIDLDRAEELFIKSIQSMVQMKPSVSHLISIYLRKGEDNVVKGLQLLEVYGYLFPADKLTNLRIQLIEKSGNYEALELILLSTIPACERKNTAWNLMAKLTMVYSKTQKWGAAVEWCKKRIDYLDRFREEFPNYQYLRNSVSRTLIVYLYYGGDKESAIQQARQLQEKLPDDYLLRSIVEGTFEVNSTQEVAYDYVDEELQYEDELVSEDEEFSAYLVDRVQKVNLGITFNKVNYVYLKTQDGMFVGNSSDVKKAISYIQSRILQKGKTVSAEYRSVIYIGIAKIILDSRNNRKIDRETKVSIDELRKFMGRYARYKADACVETYAPIDSIRYMYILALRYLVNQDSYEIAAATNMLVASFFDEGRALVDALHDLKPSEYNEAYYKQDCISAKDFLVATFMLRDKQEYVNNILLNIYENPKLREKSITALNRINNQEAVISTQFDFEAAWKTAKSIYENTVEQIGKEISETVDEYLMVESVRQHASRIEELIETKVLWNQDESVLKAYMEILSTLGNTFEKYTVKEKIDGYRLVEATIRKLKRDIGDSPTELSYDYVYTHLDALSYAVRGRFDELYQSSRPECDIYLSNDAVYVNERRAEIAITFRNAADKQDADAVEIDLSGSEGATFIRCDKKFTSIKSGEAQDYLAVFNIDDKVMADGQFDVSVNLKYQYHDAAENIAAFSTMEVLPVNVSDKENFVSIPNKYDRIFRGSSVDVKTPDLFKGRNELIDSICSSMSSDGIMLKNRGIILWGQRRVGKNSVKDYLKERIRKEYPNAYIIIELGSIGKCRNLREVLITIINQTEDALMQPEYENLYDQLIDSGMVFDGHALEKTENYMPEFNRFMDRLSKRLTRIGDSEQNIPLYFIDEFSYLYEWIEKGEIDGKEFMRFWKSFIQDYGVCAIIIAQDNIPVWKSRYENEFACMNHDNEITFLDFDGANALICEPCQIDGKSLFTPEAVDLIYNWTKGSAYLIVIFCKYIIDYLNENYMEKATKTIVQIVFEKEFLDKKGMFLSEDFEPQIQDVANVGHEGEVINRLNEVLLKEIATATISSPQTRIDELAFFNESEDRELAQKVFDRLRDRKIIEVERDTYCSISMPLLKFYLLREQALLSRDFLNKLVR